MSRGEFVEIDLVLEHRGQDMGNRLAVEELVPGEHLPQHDAEGPDIGPPVGGDPGRLLRRHVGRGADDDPGGGGVLGQGRRQRERGVVVLGVPRLGEPEVEDLDRAVGSDLDVGGFEIAVDDALLVRRLEGLGDLEGDGDGLVHRDRAASDALGEILAVDELHDEEGDGRRCQF